MTELPKWKQTAIFMKRRIVSGQWKPGGSLPVYEQLEKEFSISSFMMLKVIRQMKADGYITSIPRCALFVSKKPSCLFRAGLTVPKNVEQIRFWHELYCCIQAEIQKRGMQLVLYPCMETSEESREKLKNDVEAGRLAALFMMHTEKPDGLWKQSDSPLPFPVPQLILGGCSIPGCPAVRLQMRNDELADKAVHWLAEQNIRRIVYIGNTGENHPVYLKFREILAENPGLYCPEKWQFLVAMECKDVIRKIILVMMDYPEDQKPEGIFLADDNYIQVLQEGLEQCGMLNRIPVVTHYNWPVSERHHAPFRCIGYDLGNIAHRFLDEAAEYHRTGQLPDRMEAHALFAEELTHTGDIK